jgi:ergothioneine biosynthesis protein EgtB
MTKPERNIKTRFADTRKHSEKICAPLEVEDHTIQPVADVSPPKWHLGHTTWFFEAFVLRKYVPAYPLFHEDYAYLFNSYYNHEGERVLRPNRGFMSRPPLREVMNYRKYVTEAVLDFLDCSPNEEALKTIEIGINHEQQHQELLIYDIKFILGHQQAFPAYRPGFITEPEKETGFASMAGGLYPIGATEDGFVFDNELGRHQVYLHPFAISKMLVTNKEYLEFIKDGGYQNFDLWLADGWEFIQKGNIEAPLYWHWYKGEWYHYTLNGLELVNEDLPVQHVSFYEANAFANWKGMRIPTEFEWEAASGQFNWGQLWEWTYSAYLPYPGFKKVDGALGEYNGKFMVNQHVLRGASVATPGGHSRFSYRNFFHPSARWIFSGIRLVK